ncbi:acidic leucine-rich nuclear phosphoprotein 32-related protein [Tanacetum coccineum]
MMDEIWERAVVTALDGQTDMTSVRALTLDGAVKCVQGRLPHPSLFQKFTHLQHLSLANIGVSSLEQFPNLSNLQKLILSDNRIATGLEYLVSAGLESLRDLDLSNNRISDVEDLRPLADLRIVSLDLYECPVTRVKDYRSRVFALIKSLKYLDKMDVDENERPESDDEEEEEDDDEAEEDEDEDDPGSGEIDGEEKEPVLTNGHVVGNDGVVDVDEDDESDADEEESEIVRGSNGASVSGGQVNGFHSDPVDVEEDDEDGDGEGGDDVDGESDEIDEEDGEDEEDVIEVHESDDSEDEEDGVEDDDDEDDDEEVDNDDGDVGEPGSTGWVTSTEGEIDGHEQGEDDVDEDDDGETGEEEIGVEEGDFEDDEEAEDEEEEDEDGGTGYLVQPVGQVSEAGDEEDDPEVDEEEELEEDDNEDDEENGDGVDPPPSSSSSGKRKRSGDDDDDDGGDAGEGDDDLLTNTLAGKSSTVVRRRGAHLMETVFSHQNLSIIHAPGDNTSIRASPYGGCCVAHGNMVHIYDWMLEEDPPISHVDGI